MFYILLYLGELKYDQIKSFNSFKIRKNKFVIAFKY